MTDRPFSPLHHLLHLLGALATTGGVIAALYLSFGVLGVLGWLASSVSLWLHKRWMTTRVLHAQLQTVLRRHRNEEMEA